MIILRQKEFNSKAQKAMRRKWDLEQAMDYNTDLNNKVKEAISQDSMLGREKTNELLDKATKQTKTKKTGFFTKETKIYGKDRKELDEMTNATELLRAGRKRSKIVSDDDIYTKKEKRDNNFDTKFNRRITTNEGGNSYNGSLGANKSRKSDYRFDDELKRRDRARKLNKKVSNVGKFIKDHKGLAIGGAAVGTAALVGSGIALHRRNKKKKEEEEKKKSK